MRHMLLVWHSCPTGLATAGCILGRRDWQTKCLFSRQHMQAAGNEPLLTSSRQCGWDKFIENSNRSSGLQHNDQMRL